MRKFGIIIDSGQISYSIVDSEENIGQIIYSGILRFPNGMANVNGEELSITKERTELRNHRKLIKRKRLRKIELLTVCSKYGYCPPVSEKELLDWRYKKIYPVNEAFRSWLLTDIKNHKNPYVDRVICINRKLDFTKQNDCYIFGRAMYHICGHRGYLSNAKLDSRNNDAGEVNSSIKLVSDEIQRLGFRTLGEYLNNKMVKGERVRGIYTSRLNHYQVEFDAICDFQEIPEEIRKELYEAIFYTRPLKSQKKNVGKCVFESRRFRCQTSQPIFEEFRMLQFINNIKVKSEGEKHFHKLTKEQIDDVKPLFYRKQKNFEFVEIVNKLCGKANKKGERLRPMEFNYRNDDTVTGCPTSSLIIKLLGCSSDEWKSELFQRYKKTVGASGAIKDEEDVVVDVWRVLDTFDNSGRKVKWLLENIDGITEEDAKMAGEAVLAEGYQAISVNFIRKAIRWHREGYRYDEAVFLYNVESVLPECTKEEIVMAENAIIASMNEFEDGYSGNRNNKTKEEAVVAAIIANSFGKRIDFSKLHHPSQVKKFPMVKPSGDGYYRLGSPMDGNLKNPMVMRSLTELRHLCNSFLVSGEITPDTEVHICLSREMNSKNDREGIRMWQKEHEKQNSDYSDKIKDFYIEKFKKEIIPSDEMILKYRLWEEQKHICLYTGDKISLERIFGSEADCDITYTIPISRNGDDTAMNKTLCTVEFIKLHKGTCIPSELKNHNEILNRLDSIGVSERIRKLESSVALNKKRGKNALDPSIKATNLRYKAKDQMDLEYWRGKYFRFNTDVIPKGIAFEQDTIGRTIRAYAASFLKSVFKDVQTVNQDTLNSFRRIWGFDSKSKLTTKNYDTIDSSVVACIDNSSKKAWIEYWKQKDEHTWSASYMPIFKSPWPSFVQDVLKKSDNVIVRSSVIDRLKSGNKHKVKDNRGHIRRNINGQVIYQKSDKVPFGIYEQSIYGIIDVQGEKRAVKRVNFTSLRLQDINKIVDPFFRTALESSIKEIGFDRTLQEFRYNGKPVRHVRCFSYGTVNNLISVKKHRDLSKNEYRSYVYQKNDKNYALAIYEDVSRIINGHSISQAVRNSSEFVPMVDSMTGKKLTALYVPGTKLIIYNSLEEIDISNEQYVSEHLFVIKNFWMNGRKACVKMYKAKDRSCACVQKQFDGFNALVEGVDFYMDRKSIIHLK